MRIFKINENLYQVNGGQYTQDEKQALIDAAQTDEELAAANAIIACAPAGAVELTGQDLEVFLNPPKTYTQERAELSEAYQAQLKANAELFAMTQYMDGENEEANKAASRAELAELKAQHQADLAALFTKYFGG